MNNYPIPLIPINNNYNLLNEIAALKDEIKKLNDRITKIENEKKNEYLKEDNNNYYMI